MLSIGRKQMSKYINEITLKGKLVAPPNTRYSEKNNLITKLLLSTSDKEDDSSVIEVVCWGKLAKSAKGIQSHSVLLIKGHLQKDSWLRTDTNTTQYNLRIIADNIAIDVTSTSATATLNPQ